MAKVDAEELVLLYGNHIEQMIDNLLKGANYTMKPEIYQYCI